MKMSPLSDKTAIESVYLIAHCMKDANYINSLTNKQMINLMLTASLVGLSKKRSRTFPKHFIFKASP